MLDDLLHGVSLSLSLCSPPPPSISVFIHLIFPGSFIFPGLWRASQALTMGLTLLPGELEGNYVNLLSNPCQ